MQQICNFLRINRLAKYVAIALATLLVVGIIAGIVRQLSPKDNNAIHIAIAAPVSSNRNAAAQEMIQSVQLYLKTVNNNGGINGHPLKLLVFDDRDYYFTARQLTKNIQKSPALVVLGHLTSSTSEAAAPLYKDFRIPVITGTASADVITQNNSYYFRTTFTNSRQGSLLALYAQQVLKYNTASIIYSDDNLGETLHQAFATTFEPNGTLKKSWDFYSKTEDIKETVNKIVDSLAAEPDPGIVFLAMNDNFAKEFIVAIKKRQLNVSLLGNNTLARETFPSLFQEYDEEKRQPGYFINGISVAVPIILDSANANAQELASAYQQAYGKIPTYVGAGFYEAAKVAVQAIQQANVQNIPASYESDRQRIRDQLEAINNEDVGVSGLNGAIYFDQQHNTIPPTRFGKFVGRTLISAPVQLSPVANLGLVNLEQEISAGNIIPLTNSTGKQYFWRQEVVYTGIDINKLSRVDQSKSSFTADFYLWMRYSSNANAPAIEFPTGIANSLNQNEPLFDLKKPIKATTIDGLNYRLYHISGDFKGSYDFHDYPFDRQKLKIYFQNTRLPSDRLIYVVDTFGLKLPKSDAEVEKKPYQSLQLWKFQGIQYAQDTFVSTSTRGNPRFFNSNIQVDYPGLSTTITLQRRYTVFLSKALLPLALLVLVLYSTLYFSHNLAKERLTVAISVLLSSAVLLTAINSQLSDTGYTVAIEYGFYIFFSLCLFCILIGLIVERLRLAEKKIAMKYLNYFARFFYVMVVFTTITTYWVAFGNRL
ncbi:ABC transporter substrate-binding protein [Nostoc sp. CHAB 5844]|nr:ABC transporter substrate-binding protein [Nostoc sp. CHAB 5844]